MLVTCDIASLQRFEFCYGGKWYQVYISLVTGALEGVENHYPPIVKELAQNIADLNLKAIMTQRHTQMSLDLSDDQP